MSRPAWNLGRLNSSSIPINSLLNPSSPDESWQPQTSGCGSFYPHPGHKRQESILTNGDSEKTPYRRLEDTKSSKQASTPPRADDIGDVSDAFTPESSGSSTVSERRRPPRPKYDEEEMYFIWYHRVDLELEWKDVQESFNRQFPGRQRSGFQGIQCKFYRFIKDKRCPSVRSQRHHHVRKNSSTKSREPNKFGVVQFARVWYPWMRPEHAKFLQSSSPKSISSTRNQTPGYSDASYSAEEILQ
jgi:hypothetical protein